MTIQGAREQITTAVLQWPTVTAAPHRFGGTEFLIGRREISHIHGDSLVDIPFPSKVRDELIAAGRAEAHHVLPDSGWVSFHIHQPGDIERAITLLRQSYEIATRQKQRVS